MQFLSPMDNIKKDLLYLTGFMGSGKSSIAPILANTLGYDSVDVDVEVEKITGKKVSEIFFELGEDYFRSVERTLLEELSKRHGCVISLGGGTIASASNLSIIKSTGVLVYLKLDAEHIFRRLKSKKNRPLLFTKEGAPIPDEELRAKITALLTDREPFYKQADVTIIADDLRIGLTVDEIVRHTRRLIS